MAAPSILDTLEVATTFTSAATSQSYSYTVPAGGANKLFCVFIGIGSGGVTPTATLNGVSISLTMVDATANQLYCFFGYLAAPSTGTLSITTDGTTNITSVPFTLQDAAQASPIDISGATHNNSTTLTTTVTTTQADDAILAFGTNGNNAFTLTVAVTQVSHETANSWSTTGYRAGAAIAGSEAVIGTGTGIHFEDLYVVAIKGPSSAAAIIQNPALLTTMAG